LVWILLKSKKLHDRQMHIAGTHNLHMPVPITIMLGLGRVRVS
jgi:hypothetical protein